MITNGTISNFTSIKANGYVDLSWTYTLQAGSDIISYKLYRFIGNPDTVYTRAQVELPSTSWTQIKEFTGSEMVVGNKTYRDSFTGVSPSRILQILQNRCVVYYKIELIIDGIGSDSLPWVVIPYTDNGTSYIAAYSVKQQVLNNVLYGEGDCCWSRKVAGVNFSRTAVDPRGISQYDTGVIPSVWVTDRNAFGWIFQYNLLNGDTIASKAVWSDVSGNARGITINSDGAAITSSTYSTYKGGLRKVESYSGALHHSQFASSGSGYGLTKAFHGYYFGTHPYGGNKCSKYTATGQLIEMDIGINSYGICMGADGAVFMTPWRGNNDIVYLYGESGGIYYTSIGTIDTGLFDFGANPDTCIRGISNANTQYKVDGSLNYYEIWAAHSMYPLPDGANGPQFGPAYPNYGILRYKIIPGAGTPALNRIVISTGNWETTPSPNTTLTNDPSQIYVRANGSLPLMAVGEDGNKNVWIGSSGFYCKYSLHKVYVGSDSSNGDPNTYPNGYNCRYPTSDYESFQNMPINNKAIEYFLTRDPNDPNLTVYLKNQWISRLKVAPPVAGITFNTMVDAVDTGGKVPGYSLGSTYTPGSAVSEADALSWIALVKAADSNYSVMGRKLYPQYVNASKYIVGPGGKEVYTNDFKVVYFAPIYTRSQGAGNFGSYVYSDYTGGNAALLESEYTEKLVLAPTVSAGSCTSFMLTGINTETSLDSIDGIGTWDEVIGYPKHYDEGTTIHKSTTGYDDLNVNFKVSYDERDTPAQLIDIIFGDGITGRFAPITISGGTIYKYLNPTKYGLRGESLIGTGYYESSAIVYFQPNYYTSSQMTSCIMGPLYTTVLERWPSACFGITLQDKVDWRGSNWGLWNYNTYTVWNKDDQDRNIVYGGNIFDYGITVVGTDPVSAVISDFSIARTYPITAWEFTVDKTDKWSPESTTFRYETVSDTFSDNRELRSNMVGDVYPLSALRYGTYEITLTAYASSGTPSPNEYKQFVNVLEYEPYANFWAVRAMTVSAQYQDTTLGLKASDLIEDRFAGLDCINPYTGSYYVSGYAPNLTVWFVDSSEGHTFPISSYNWNFGDYYDMITNTEVVTADAIITGTFTEPDWSTDVVNHTAVHVYVMPGVYNVTLTVEASNTSTPDICSKYVALDDFYIYVEELPPTCGFLHSLSSTSGWTVSTLDTGLQSPQTIYYNLSAAQTGSFPIGRIDLDFGDGSDIVSIYRIPLTETYLDGTSSINISNISPIPFAEDLDDPRNKLIQHTFNSYYTASSFTVSMSAYASNTNTVGKGCTLDIENVAALPLPPTTLEKRHLIKSRYIKDNDLLLVFEGETTNMKTIYNVVVGENNDN